MHCSLSSFSQPVCRDERRHDAEAQVLTPICSWRAWRISQRAQRDRGAAGILGPEYIVYNETNNAVRGIPEPGSSCKKLIHTIWCGVSDARARCHFFAVGPVDLPLLVKPPLNHGCSLKFSVSSVSSPTCKLCCLVGTPGLITVSDVQYTRYLHSSNFFGVSGRFL